MTERNDSRTLLLRLCQGKRICFDGSVAVYDGGVDNGKRTNRRLRIRTGRSEVYGDLAAF